MAVSWLKFLFSNQHKYSNSTWVVLSKDDAAESLPLPNGPNHHGFGPSAGGPPPRPSSSSSSSSSSQPSHQAGLLQTIDCEDSSSLLPSHSDVTQQLSVQREMASGQAVAVQPSTRKSIIFPPPRPSSSSSSSSQPSHQAALMLGELKTIDCEDSSLLPSEVTQQQLSVQQETASSEAVAVQPSTRKSIIFPTRPGNGNAGVECVVKANHFFAEFQFPDKDLYQYDVTITPEVVTSCVNRAVMEQLVELYKVSHLGHRLPAYDGRKSLYTAGPLPFLTKEFTITLLDDDGGNDDGSGCPRRREREFKVVIELAAFYDLDQANARQQTLHQILNTVLQQLPITRYCLVGRSFCSPNFGRVHPLGKTLESWRGFYQSIRPTQMGLSLNIDVSSNAFMKPLPVIEFVILLLNRDDSSRPLSDDDCLKIEKALRGVKVEVTHHGKICRKYRIFGLTSQATQELMFSVDDSGTMKSVVEYFREKYGLVIRYIRWPCLKVGNQQMPIYLPMEVCKIVEGQSYSERLDESQITALRNVTCQRPEDREHDIIEAVHHKAYAEDPYVKEFGIKISENPVSVEARILPAPLLKYHDTGREKDCLPQVGQWNMRNKKMVNGGAVNSWVCINLTTYVLYSEARRFCYYLGKMCAALGMAFNPDPVLPFFGVHPERVESGLKDLSAKLKVEELDLLIAILPHTKEDRGSVYGLSVA